MIFTEPALEELGKIAENSRREFGDAVATALDAAIQRAIVRIERLPKGARRVAQRRNVHVVPLIRFPFKIYYRIVNDAAEIVHIRHTARRRWKGED